jgi:hypothetical protein
MTWSVRDLNASSLKQQIRIPVKSDGQGRRQVCNLALRRDILGAMPHSF